MTIPPIAAEAIFHFGSFAITNSLLTAWAAVALFIVLAVLVNRSLTSGAPGRFQSAVEALLEFMLGYVDQVTGDRAKSRKFLPLVGTLFLFILACNWMGALPGFGSITRTVMVDGHLENAPLLRPANADLNLTLAMALLTVVTSHVVGMITVGFFAHWNRFIALGTVVRGFKKGGINIMVGLIEMVVGFIELVSEVAKVASLSLRLFGNIFAGEVLMTVMFSLVAYVVPLPFSFLELIVGVVQATVFSMLALVYLTILSEKPHGGEEEHDEDSVGEAHGIEPHPAQAS
jgi:F-type H+-transporting ATPase subunit a